jgi:putative FmdB family regulatory protein
VEGRKIPLFSYQCEACGLRFERRGKATNAQAPRECPGCEQMADRVPSDSLGFTFNNEHTHEGPVPQNTGVSATDYDFDRVIGADARKRYTGIKQRDQRKREVLRDSPGGTTTKDLSVLPNGDYRVMATEERQTVRNTRAFHNLAIGLRSSSDRYQMLRSVSDRDASPRKVASK